MEKKEPGFMWRDTLSPSIYLGFLTHVTSVERLPGRDFESNMVSGTVKTIILGPGTA